MQKNHPVNNMLESLEFTSVKVHPILNELVVGTSTGLVLKLRLPSLEKVWEYNEKRKNEYGEEVPVNSSILSIAYSHDYTYIYAVASDFAVCLNERTGERLGGIPVNEPIVASTLSNSGEIAILSEVGYLSVWSPKFYSRLSHFDIEKKFRTASLNFVDTEHLIILSPENEIISCNFSKRYYDILSKHPLINYVSYNNVMSSNEEFLASISEDGKLTINSLNRVDDVKLNSFRDVDVTQILQNKNSKDIFKQIINSNSTSKSASNRVSQIDPRQNKLSKDRYELHKDVTLGHHQSGLSLKHDDIPDIDPDFILHHTFMEYSQNPSSETKILLLRHSLQFNIDPKLGYFAWTLQNKTPDGLISFTKRLEEERESRLFKLKIVYGAMFLLSVIVFSLQLYSTENSVILILTFLVLVTFLVLEKISKQINRLPVIPLGENFRPMIYLSRFFILISVGILLFKLLKLSRFLTF